MRLLADESVDGRVIAALCAAGHDVMAVARVTPGLGDDQVLDLATSHGRLLITEDKDFGSLVYWHRRKTIGVVLVRLGSLAANERVRLVATVFEQQGEQLMGAFTVITRAAVRIRRLRPGYQGEP